MLNSCTLSFFSDFCCQLIKIQIKFWCWIVMLCLMFCTSTRQCGGVSYDKMYVTLAQYNSDTNCVMYRSVIWILLLLPWESWTIHCLFYTSSDGGGAENLEIWCSVVDLFVQCAVTNLTQEYTEYVKSSWNK